MPCSIHNLVQARICLILLRWCGKSTFLKFCSHLISPTVGTITFKDKSITEYSPTELRKRIVYCFQTPYLFGDTVIENINFPFSIRNVKPDTEKINELFSMFHRYVVFCKVEDYFIKVVYIP
ncbi:MAG: ATP-binding cassette domain-containing protein [Firmicutes bacterium]|nr:ATP-binding cassette domain-containing protein [Bacillota bacterium]